MRKGKTADISFLEKAVVLFLLFLRPVVVTVFVRLSQIRCFKCSLP